jgi:hypothetical protein
MPKSGIAAFLVKELEEVLPPSIGQWFSWYGSWKSWSNTCSKAEDLAGFLIM